MCIRDRSPKYQHFPLCVIKKLSGNIFIVKVKSKLFNTVCVDYVFKFLILAAVKFYGMYVSRYMYMVPHVNSTQFQTNTDI